MRYINNRRITLSRSPFFTFPPLSHSLSPSPPFLSRRSFPCPIPIEGTGKEWMYKEFFWREDEII
jgi:hypothetical protein